MTDPRFDHRDRGTPASEWHTILQSLPEGAAIGGHDHLLVLAAHPDDETLGAGGLIADAAAAGAIVTIVVATRGERSHPRSPSHTPADLSRIRTAEMTAAAQHLAPDAKLVHLDLPDGALASSRRALTEALRVLAESATVIAAPWTCDGHPDHDCCGQIAVEIADVVGARTLLFPIWAWHWGKPGTCGPAIGPGWVTRSMTAAARERKNSAIRTHISQHLPLSPAGGDEALLSPSMLEHFADRVEIFLAGAPRDLSPGYFDRLYSASPDPWRLSSGFYEDRKRSLLLASLPRQRFRRTFEPGCALGITTSALAERTSALLACDVSKAAVSAAKARNSQHSHVSVEHAAVPGDWPDGEFDLIVISELGYYLADLAGLCDRIHNSLSSDGVLAAVHWRHPAPGYPTTTERVHRMLGQGLHTTVEHMERDFLLGVWSKSALSVAQEHGVV